VGHAGLGDALVVLDHLFGGDQLDAELYPVGEELLQGEEP
jgi:hypothetical protein